MSNWQDLRNSRREGIISSNGTSVCVRSRPLESGRILISSVSDRNEFASSINKKTVLGGDLPRVVSTSRRDVVTSSTDFFSPAAENRGRKRGIGQRPYTSQQHNSAVKRIYDI